MKYTEETSPMLGWSSANIVLEQPLRHWGLPFSAKAAKVTAKRRLGSMKANRYLRMLSCRYRAAGTTMRAAHAACQRQSALPAATVSDRGAAADSISFASRGLAVTLDEGKNIESVAGISGHDPALCPIWGHRLH